MTPADTAPAWDGRPENPDADGWYWLINSAGRCTMYWLASAGGWCGSDSAAKACDMPPDEAVDYYDACEPCLTPVEVQAREAAAWAAGAEAMKEAAAADVDWTVRTFEKGQGRLWQEMVAAFSAQADEIRALPLPPMPTQGGRDAG